MADQKTINAFVPHRGDLKVGISAAAVTAITAFTTAQAISIKGVLRKFERSNTPARPEESMRVSGHPKPLSFVGGVEETEKWRIVIVDDFFKGAAGEWGTDLLTAYEIFDLHLRHEIPLDSLVGTPAGEATGMKSIVLDTPITVLSVTPASIDADAKRGQELEIIVSTPGHEYADHA
ncbi:MAG: hypothetical protein IPM39_24885 [Chloroflexi bacterium]|nr:hypothetical protein [Chloroflexota bacterium]